MKKRAYQLLAAVLGLVFVVSAGYIIYKTVDYQKGAEDYEEAARVAGLPKLFQFPVETLGPGETAAPEQEGDPYASALAGVDLEALQAVNSGVLGWIAIPETELSYPIVQGSDNTYYLNRTWSRERSSAGAIFLECKCAADFSDFNTIIYGHRMNNTSMFGTLKFYQDSEYWRAHPSVYIRDADGVRRYDIFAAFEVGVRDVVYRLNVTEDVEKEAIIRFALEHSAIDTGLAPGAEDSIITLSTCTRSNQSTRWVVLAVLHQEDGIG